VAFVGAQAIVVEQAIGECDFFAQGGCLLGIPG
jgi:hypothetical protein